MGRKKVLACSHGLQERKSQKTTNAGCSHKKEKWGLSIYEGRGSTGKGAGAVVLGKRRILRAGAARERGDRSLLSSQRGKGKYRDGSRPGKKKVTLAMGKKRARLYLSDRKEENGSTKRAELS